MQPNLTDQYILDDMLCEEKQLISLYGTAITESGCPNLRRAFQQNMITSLEDQYQVFTQMKDLGFYQPKDAQSADVQQAVQKMTQTKGQL
ncbi:MAG: spore coat protein [Eubacteriales bacterium]|nr:spore coat protein [Eubacteriales bacterium]